MDKPLKLLKKYFIPHKHNDFKPHLLRHESTLLMLVFIVIIELVFLAQVFIVFDKTNFLASVLPGVLTTLTNQQRAQNDAAPLVENNLLNQAAQLKASDMAKNGYFSHTSPDGKTPWYWFDQVGYKYSTAGENLAVNFFDSNDVAQAWMSSPTHRENIVKKKYTEIGIGVATGVFEGKTTVFVAQLFGTPALVAPIEPIKEIKNTNVTTLVKLQPKAGQPTAEKTPKVTPKAPAPVVTPSLVATTPTATQVLGEETNSTIKTAENTSIFSNIKLFLEKVLASPRGYVTYVYGGIALIVTITLLLAMLIKREAQHPLAIARGFTVVAIVILFTFLNIKVFQVETKVPTDGLSASVIAY